jgi:Cdc6-like AAA superfamily ATPase
VGARARFLLAILTRVIELAERERKKKKRKEKTLGTMNGQVRVKTRPRTAGSQSAA